MALSEEYWINRLLKGAFGFLSRHPIDINKIATLFAALFFFCPIAEAQVAPDFYLTDTKGKQWHLYEEIGKGKTVVIDFFFVNCVPCKTWSPELANAHADYLKDSSSVLFFGVSDRDDNVDIDTFKQELNLQFPSAGSEGGGYELTNLYRSYYPFLGWPTTAVICSDTSVFWDIRPWTKGLPLLREKIDECLKINVSVPSFINEIPRVSISPNPSSNSFTLQIAAGTTNRFTVKLTDLLGQKLLVTEIFQPTTVIEWPKGIKTGMYNLILESENTGTFATKLQFLP